MVPGSPMHVTGYSSANMRAPVSEPSPPMTTSAPIFSFLMVSYASLRPSGVVNASERAVFRMVPPRWMMLLTSSVVSSLDFARYQAFVPSVNSFDFEAVENGGTGHGTDCRIHSGSVPPEVRIPIYSSFSSISVLVLFHSANIAFSFFPAVKKYGSLWFPNSHRFFPLSHGI